ncbi:hypothetical protein BDV25DRAFT_153511 [Aspergillus avenaceus]|uniref:C3H1-type domain-containing protein n=1 Tax=Aspergillus avenaceus TaxID=36643 RepID=A0A5N6TXD7_ASPAV|nr:hypothetical protein BDV25DRAFT_153511 [Aspergillus avenaceus]
MNPQGFSFPPPPPPPPTQQSQYNQNQHATFPSQYGQAHHGQRGGRGGHRGRGRGYGNRGGRGGSYMPPAANNPSVGYAPMNYSGYAAQPIVTPQQNIPTPQYTPSGSPNFQRPQNTTSYVPPRPFPQPTATHGSPYQPQPGYNAAYAPPAQQAPTYHRQNALPSVQPPMMGPPMHWGYNNAAPTGTFPGPSHGNQRGPRPYNAYNNQGPAGGHSGSHSGPHMNKRDHASAFGKPHSVAPRVPAPPPVPSFGNPLPSKPPPQADATRKPKKKKRKHNQLGLTPKADEHESSEEDDDVDEESKLAAGGAGAAAPLQITYKGRTSTLQSPAEIAAWIEERKKRFPTQARVAERKKLMEEAKKAKEEAQRQNNLRKQEMKKPQKGQAPNDPIDAAEKAKRKADKLRKKLMKEQKKVEKAEADAERARMRVEELQKGSADTNKDTPTPATQEGQLQPPSDGNAAAAPHPETEATKPQGEQSDASAPVQGLETTAGTETGPAANTTPGTENTTDNVGGDAAVSDDTSDSSDWTSSSGSDSSDSSDSDDDSAPEEATTRRQGPERVAPPPREVKKKLCRHFARTGRCQHGDKCRFLHERPERNAKTKPAEKKGRKGLLQALLDRQKEDDDRKVMEAIVWLGDNGYLETPNIPNETQPVNQSTGSDGVTAQPPLDITPANDSVPTA